MSIVAIIGAGDLGGALAHRLAGRDRIDEVRLIDTAAGVAAGKALDIQQAGPIEGFRTRVVSAGDVRAAAGAAVIVVTDSAAAASAEWQGEPGLALLKTLAQLDSEGVFVCAGASQQQLIAQGVQEAKIPRARLIGSAPGGLAAAVRAMVALEANASPADVSLVVLGSPPHHAVIPWSEATIRGHAVTQVLEPPSLARVSARVPHLWPPGPYTLASAATRVCEAIATAGSNRGYSCFVWLDREFGGRGVVSAMTVVLGPGGIDRILAPSLSGHERVQFENALERKADR